MHMEWQIGSLGSSVYHCNVYLYFMQFFYMPFSGVVPVFIFFYIYRRLSALAVVAGFFNLLLLCSIICSGGMRKSFSVFHVMHIYTCTATIKKIKMVLWECSNFLQHKWAVPLNISNHFQFWPCVQPGCNGEAYPHRL